ncbi:hypothetical protein LCGC14_2099960, partial [marine sediment metagenome]
MGTLTLREALQHAAAAGRGSLSDLGLLLRAIVRGEAGEEIQFLDGVVAGAGQAGKVLVLDSGGNLSGIPGEVELDGNTGPVAGSGILSGTDTLYKSSVVKIGDIIYTSIYIDLDGLASEATEDDIIGDTTAVNSHLGQITAAKNGTIIGGVMKCLEVPTTGEPDLDLNVSSASDAAGGDDIGAEAGYAKIFDAAANSTLGLQRALSGVIVANYYLYLSVGTGSTP